MYHTPDEIDTAFLEQTQISRRPVEIARNSEDGKKFRKIFKLEIKEREQVSKKDKRFNAGKTKTDLQYF